MKNITGHSAQPAFNLVGEPMKNERGDDAEVSFTDFVAGRLADPSFGANVPAVLSAYEIKKQLDKANGVLVLENADYERLKTATETPSPQTAYNTQMSRSLVPFMKAIRDAADEAPAEETAAAEETEPDASQEAE